MTVLHYTIGLPPTRMGGSVQYAYDLMMEQAKTANVIALTCGETLFRSNISKIKYHYKNENVQVYNLTNPLTPTLIYGTRNPSSQYRDIKIDYQNIRQFIISNEVRILHLHTLMGLHSNLVKYIKELGVKIIYTTHDFHGICPHYNFINENGEICDTPSSKKCTLCNQKEPSDFFLRIANSSLYHFLKSHSLIPNNRNNSTAIRKASTHLLENKKYQDFDKLINYYKDYFRLIDKFHFNSSQTRDKFEAILGRLNGDVIPVITKGINDKRMPLQKHNKSILGFIGGIGDYKGFPTLKNILIDLNLAGINNIKLKVYGTPFRGVDNECKLIEYCGKYKYSDISEIMYGLDATIVPSKWYETFSLVTLESLAHGRPAIISDHVGAKDIVSKYNPNFIFNSSTELKSLLLKISDNPSILTQENHKILSNPWKLSIESHTNDIFSFYEF